MEKLRVSCVAFCRIEHEGRYLFMLNAARARNDYYSATPIGGALEYTDPAIMAALDAEPETPHTKELRFYIPKSTAKARLARLRAWFNRRAGRELDPFRELREELVEEQKILPALAREDVRITLAYTQEKHSPTNRPGVRHKETYYFREVFDVEITNPAVMRRLLKSDGQRGAFWLTRQEAENGKPLQWENKAVKVELTDVLRNDGAPQT